MKPSIGAIQRRNIRGPYILASIFSPAPASPAPASSLRFCSINPTTFELAPAAEKDVDLDWEYPEIDDMRAAAEKTLPNFPSFMKNLKQAVKNYEVSITQPTFLFCIGSNSLLEYLQHFDLKNLVPHVDFFNMKTYDFQGVWNKRNARVGPIHNSHANLTEIKDGSDLLWRNNIDARSRLCGRGSMATSSACLGPGYRFESGTAAQECSAKGGALLNPEIDGLTIESGIVKDETTHLQCRWTNCDENCPEDWVRMTRKDGDARTTSSWSMEQDMMGVAHNVGSCPAGTKGIGSNHEYCHMTFAVLADQQLSGRLMHNETDNMALNSQCDWSGHSPSSSWPSCVKAMCSADVAAFSGDGSGDATCWGGCNIFVGIPVRKRIDSSTLDWESTAAGNGTQARRQLGAGLVSFLTETLVERMIEELFIGKPRVSTQVIWNDTVVPRFNSLTYASIYECQMGTGYETYLMYDTRQWPRYITCNLPVFQAIISGDGGDDGGSGSCTASCASGPYERSQWPPRETKNLTHGSRPHEALVKVRNVLSVYGWHQKTKPHDHLKTITKIRELLREAERHYE
ncbi:hypothetical protein DL771_006789 [Monosporascus sp. 5C6A]|nr:hypothetical protein DL771_006789 [Monosporascus sp. 5C6A]